MLLNLPPVVFFGGKGGVGKTTLASAYALHAADRGDRTLLVSTDPAHSTSDIFGHDLGSRPTPVTADLHVLEIDPDEETSRYIDGVKRNVAEVAAPRLLAEVERQIDAARWSPGSEEAAIFERFARILAGEDGEYESIVFDTAPTGQTVRLLSLPEIMSDWTRALIGRRRKLNTMGRMWRNVAGAAAGDERDRGDPVIEALERRRALFQRARRTLTDPERTAFVFVVQPERLAVRETRRAIDTLHKYDIPVGAVLVNRVLPDGVEGELMRSRRSLEQRYVAEIERQFGRYPVLLVPLRGEDVLGVEALRRLQAVVGRMAAP